MEHNTNRVSLTDIVTAFVLEKNLPFAVNEYGGFNKIAGIVYSEKHRRTRAIVWESEPHEHYSSAHGACVTIYNLDPKKGYTAVGDRRCDISAADPTFFEQLEYHLQHEFIE